MSGLYVQTVPVFIKFLKNLSKILDKGAAYATEKGIAHDEMSNLRLIDDMKGLPYQIQCCSNTAKFCLERLGKVKDLPVWPDDETTFDQLKARIAETVALLEKADPACMDGMESREVLFETKSAGTFRFETGQRYVSEFAITNFHFHMGIAYCILRQKGVDVGAFDYMNDVFVKV